MNKKGLITAVLASCGINDILIYYVSLIYNFILKEQSTWHIYVNINHDILQKAAYTFMYM